MVLHEFIDKWIMRNTLLRIWKPEDLQKPHLRKLLLTQIPIMEWEAGAIPYLREAEVIGVTDIFFEECREAVNVVVNTTLEPEEVSKLVFEWRGKREKERSGRCNG